MQFGSANANGDQDFDRRSTVGARSADRRGRGAAVRPQVEIAARSTRHSRGMYSIDNILTDYIDNNIQYLSGDD